MLFPVGLIWSLFTVVTKCAIENGWKELKHFFVIQNMISCLIVHIPIITARSSEFRIHLSWGDNCKSHILFLLSFIRFRRSTISDPFPTDFALMIRCFAIIANYIFLHFWDLVPCWNGLLHEFIMEVYFCAQVCGYTSIKMSSQNSNYFQLVHWWFKAYTSFVA